MKKENFYKKYEWKIDHQSEFCGNFDTDECTLENLIEALECIEGVSGGGLLVSIAPGLYPGEFFSYRGDYEQLCFDVSNKSKTVSEFLEQCKKQVGSTHQGWKGGSFYMTAKTQVYISEDRLALRLRCLGFTRYGSFMRAVLFREY